MGLDACVYMSRRRVERLFGVQVVEVCPLTAEVLAVADRQCPATQALRACHERIGNIAGVANLRNSLEGKVADTSIIMARVLYNGTHGGDTIEVSHAAELQRELQSIARASGLERDRSVDVFLAEMDRLVQSSLAEQNPIVFT